MSCSRNGRNADAALKRAEMEAMGTDATIFDYEPLLQVEPYEGASGGDTPCNYGSQVDRRYWQDAPIDAQSRKSHLDWVNNRREWSGTARYKQEAIEVVVPSGWRGLRPPEPVPQSCDRGELTEYGPADFAEFVTSHRKKCDNPVLSARAMAHVPRLPFRAYGF